jgi:DNA-binding transcriptional LysR family regulator
MGTTRMSVDWNDYRIFLAIARNGTLSEAARKLGLSQPTMGRRLSALEQALGHLLFQRTADGYVLSSEGRSILNCIEQIEEQSTAIERKLAGESVLDGLVRVSTTEWFGAHVLAPIFVQVRADHPGLVIELITETRLASLARREADLSFRFREFDEMDVIQTRATGMDFGVYASRAYLERHSPITPELSSANGEGHTLITMDTQFGDLADVPWLMTRLPRAEVGLRANSRDVQARLCAAGAGIAVLPRQICQLDPRLVEIALDALPPGRTVWAGYHKDLKRSPRVRTVLHRTLEMLAALPS